MLQITLSREHAGRARRPSYRFLHASDLRLDAPIRGIEAVPAAFAPALRDAAHQAWAALVEAAIANRAAFVLLAGGLVGADPPSVRACAALRAGIRRLQSHGTEVVAALGPDDREPPLESWLAGIATILTPAASETTVVRNGRPLATIRVVDPRGEWRAPAGAVSLRRPAGTIAIGVVPNASVLGDDVPAPGDGTAYWALGGRPAHAVYGTDPWVVSAGTVQGRALEAADCGEKGAVLVAVAEGRIAAVDRVALDAVRFVSVEIDVTGIEQLDPCRAELLRRVGLERDAAGSRSIIAEAVLRGSRSSALGDVPLLAAQLLAALRRASVGSPLWWARVRDHTGAPRAQTPTGLARIVILRGRALSAPLPRSRFLAETFAPLFRHYEVESDLATQRERVNEAVSLALTALERATADERG